MEFGESLRSDLATQATVEKSVSAEIRKTESLLRPTQQAAAAILPPDLGLLDKSLGQLQERQAQLERVKATFSKREEINEKIQRIEAAVAALERKVEAQSAVVDFETSADKLADGMNDYTAMLNRAQPNAWPLDRINIRLGERKFEIRIGNGRWQAKCGGTLSLYFLISYQFGLLTLAKHPKTHFPGFVILDFPPVLEDGSSVHDKENYVVEPFVELLKRDDFSETQVIAVGSVFEGLDAANRVELKHVWTEGGEIEPEDAGEDGEGP